MKENRPYFNCFLDMLSYVNRDFNPSVNKKFRNMKIGKDLFRISLCIDHLFRRMLFINNEYVFCKSYRINDSSINIIDSLKNQLSDYIWMFIEEACNVLNQQYSIMSKSEKDKWMSDDQRLYFVLFLRNFLFHGRLDHSKWSYDKVANSINDFNSFTYKRISEGEIPYYKENNGIIYFYDELDDPRGTIKIGKLSDVLNSASADELNKIYDQTSEIEFISSSDLKAFGKTWSTKKPDSATINYNTGESPDDFLSSPKHWYAILEINDGYIFKIDFYSMFYSLMDMINDAYENKKPQE